MVGIFTMRPYYAIAAEVADCLKEQVMEGVLSIEDLQPFNGVSNPASLNSERRRRPSGKRSAESYALRFVERFSFQIKELGILDVRNLPMWTKQAILKLQKKGKISSFDERDIVMLDFIQATGLDVSDINGIFPKSMIRWTPGYSEFEAGDTRKKGRKKSIRKGKIVIRLPENIARAINGGMCLYYLGWKEYGENARIRRVRFLDEIPVFDKILALKNDETKKIYYFGAYR